MKLSYNIGDVCWVAMGPPPLLKGRVLASYTTKDHPARYYVIELEDPSYVHHELRDALTMSNVPEGPLPWMQADSGEEFNPKADLAQIMALVDNKVGVTDA